MQEVKQQIIERSQEIAAAKAAGITVGGVTVAASWIETVPLFATGLGMVLTSVVITANVITILQRRKEHKIHMELQNLEKQRLLSQIEAPQNSPDNDD